MRQVRFLCAMFGLFCSQVALSQNEIVLDQVSGDQIVGAQLSTKMPLVEYQFSQDMSEVYFDNYSSAFVKLHFDDTDGKIWFGGVEFEIEIEYDLSTYGANAEDFETFSGQSITVKYDPYEGSNYIDCVFKKYDDVYIADLTVTNVNISPSGYNLPTSLWLELELQAERYFLLDQVVDVPVISSLDGSNVVGEELLVSWTHVKGAVDYDLEWIFIEHSVLDDGTPVTGDFRNATRVSTTENSFLVPLTSPRGYYTFRVRANGYSAPSGSKSSTNWSYDSNAIDGVENMVGSGDVFFLSEGFLEDFNWQHSVTFAENGRKIQGLEIFDEMQRSRQNISFLQTERKAVVQNSVYDALGRPTLDLLPSPTESQGLTFYTDELKIGVDDYFDYTNFDLDVNWDTPDPLPNSQGPGKYYSTNNTDYSSPHARYIPDAGGYPFSRTIIANDGTNRVLETSGVGDKHKIGTDHTTRNFYGQPTQQELDRLFGNEAGLASKYVKIYTIDPNQQQSVSYVDSKGQTVATALVGEPPLVANDPAYRRLQEIDTRPAAETLTADLSVFNQQDDGIYHLEHTFTVPTNGVIYNFAYELNPKEVCFQCTTDECEISSIPFCEDCVYDLTIRILGPNGYIDLPCGGEPDHLCTEIAVSQISEPDLVSDFSITLDQGTYVIEKELSISSNVLEGDDQNPGWLSDFLDPANGYLCFELPVFDDECPDCFLQCAQGYFVLDDCTSNVTWVFFDESTNEIIEYPQVGGDFLISDFYVNGAIHLPTIESNIDQTISDVTHATFVKDALNECSSLCELVINNSDPCITMQAILEKDMSPGGQYFDNLAFQDFDASPSNSWLVANIAANPIPFDFTDNNNVSLNTWDEVRDNWDTAFLVDLIEYHPEYCRFMYYCHHCDDTDPSSGKEKCVAIVDRENELGISTDLELIGGRSYYDFQLEMQQAVIDERVGIEDQGPEYRDDQSKEHLLNPLGLSIQSDATLAGYQPFDNGTISDDFFSNDISTGGYILDVNTDLLSNHLLNAIPYFDNNQVLNHFSIYYLIEDPHGISSVQLDPIDITGCTGCSSFNNGNGFEELVMLFQSFHGGADITVDPLLISAGGTVSKFELFLGYYNSLRDYVAYSNVTADDWYHESQLGLNCEAVPLSSIASADEFGYDQNGFRLILPSHPLYNTFGVASDTSPSDGFIDQLADIDFENFYDNEVESTCFGACESFASEYVAENSDCLALSVQDEQELIAALTEMCQAGCSFESPLGYDGEVDLVTPVNLFLNGQYQDFYSYNEILEEILGVGHGCAFFEPQGQTASPVIADDECACAKIETFLNSIEFDDQNIPGYSLFSDNGFDELVSTSQFVTEFNEALSYLLSDLDIDLAWLTTDASNAGMTPESFLETLTFEEVLTYFIENNQSDFQATLTNDGNILLTNFSIIQNWKDFCVSGTGTLDSYFEALSCNPPAEPSEEVLCADGYNAFANFQAQVAYEEQISELSAEFVSHFKTHCFDEISSRESFTMTYELNEYQYTLYYYDQANNLIKTVPPSGVNPLSSTELPDVANYRLDSENNSFVHTDVTHHELETYYTYNSLQQLISTTTPDGGTTFFWYDPLGRLVLSQNSLQRLANNLSYTLYDELGRPVESGLAVTDQTDYTAKMVNGETYDLTSYLGLYDLARSDLQNVQSAIENHYSRNEVVKTQYDETLSASLSQEFGTPGQTNLRNRVSSVTFFEDFDGVDELSYASALHYSYDIHGNVKCFLQENRVLEELNQSFKKIEYDYDLITGNVNEVRYQDGSWDQFYQRYSYDLDNRLALVTSSNNGYIWDEDATYYYYEHGPLARLELGQNKLQASDFAYTIQGWLKGVNASSIDSDRDIGKDSKFDDLNPMDNLNRYFANDAFGFSLSYFDDDYSPIDQNLESDQSSYFLKDVGSLSNVENLHPSLYNGNIRGMITALTDLNSDPMEVFASFYQYDQLNRIKSSKVYEMPDNSLNDFSNATSSDDFSTSYKYDGNGNIAKLNRFASGQMDMMDELVYKHRPGTNQLLQVIDQISSSNIEDEFLGHIDQSSDHPYNDDFDQVGHAYMGTYDPNSYNSGTYNFKYDEIGQLVQDLSEGIENIEWTNSGKIKSIARIDGFFEVIDIDGTPTNVYPPDVTFSYDPLGNRIAKIVKPRNGSGVLLGQEDWVFTYYTRDPQGNEMAHYQRDIESSANPSYDWNDELSLKSHTLYGSSRLGQTTYYTQNALRKFNSSDPNDLLASATYEATAAFVTSRNTHHFSRKLGAKKYELVNHLGNVLATITDYKIPQPSQDPTILAFYEPVNLSFSLYYPFGMPIPDRHDDSESYRYGFNGMEKDDEVSGGGNSYDFGARIYDPRLGRFMSLDPKMFSFAHNSPYVFAENNPIMFIDLNGESAEDPKLLRSTKEINKNLKIQSDAIVYSRLQLELYRPLQAETEELVKTLKQGRIITTGLGLFAPSSLLIKTVSESAQTINGVNLASGERSLIHLNGLVSSFERDLELAEKEIEELTIEKETSALISSKLEELGVDRTSGIFYERSDEKISVYLSNPFNQKGEIRNETLPDFEITLTNEDSQTTRKNE